MEASMANSEAVTIQALLLRLQRGGQLKRLAADYVVVGLRGRRHMVAAALIEALLRRGLLREDADKIVLAKGGETWLADAARFAEQHQILTTRAIKDARGRDRYVVVNAAESPLTLLQRRGWISASAYEAGEKLRRDYTIGQLTPRMGVDYASPIHSHSYRPDMADTALAARQRFNLALKAAGPGLADILFDVCCYLKGLEESEAARGWPRGSAKVVLRLALERLADFYGMAAPTHARTRRWSMDADEDEGQP
jgi:hypothetical protein